MMNDLFSRLRLILPAVLALMASHAHAADAVPQVQLKPAWTNSVFQRPLWLCESPDGTKRLFLVEQRGRILILPKDRTDTNAVVFFDITERRPQQDNEEGLLGFAFHPQFKVNGKVYVYYSHPVAPRHSIVSEFTVSKDDANKLDSTSERVLLEIPQPYGNHNGGVTLFGPDGMLYIGLGDGGAGRDPHGNGQNMNTLLAKIIRIDVNGRDQGLQYAVPKDNPFTGKEGVRPEIWALGLRNPWRISFDRQTGALYAADVGQDKWEEICIITKGGNYGWSTREAFHDFNTNMVIAAGTKLIEPILEYPHNPSFDTNNITGPGLSITGGYVYRGKKLPSLRGWYVFGDFNFGTIWALRYTNGQVTGRATLTPQLLTRNVASFGEDGDGELYVLTYEPPQQTRGRIYEFEELK